MYLIVSSIHEIKDHLVFCYFLPKSSVVLLLYIVKTRGGNSKIIIIQGLYTLDTIIMAQAKGNLYINSRNSYNYTFTYFTAIYYKSYCTISLFYLV